MCLAFVKQQDAQHKRRTYPQVSSLLLAVGTAATILYMEDASTVTCTVESTIPVVSEFDWDRVFVSFLASKKGNAVFDVLRFGLICTGLAVTLPLV